MQAHGVTPRRARPFAAHARADYPYIQITGGVITRFSARRLAFNPLLLAASAAAQAQTGSAPPSFDVASIKLSAPDNRSSRFETNPGMLRLINQTLRGCIRAAYAGGGAPLRDYQIVGGPKWIDSDRYDIVAKADGRAAAPQLVLMLQALLADRFQLVVHRESRQFPGYALAPAKGGLRIKPDPAEGDPPRAISDRGSLAFVRAPLTWLPRMLSTVVDAPVVDDVQIAGVYSFTLEWNPDDSAPEGAAAVPAAQTIAPASLLAALEQLGLRLEACKAPLGVIVVDRAEKPTKVRLTLWIKKLCGPQDNRRWLRGCFPGLRLPSFPEIRGIAGPSATSSPVSSASSGTRSYLDPNYGAD